MTLALVTGANGFIGRHLSRELRTRGWEVRAAVRSPHRLDPQADMEVVMIGDPLSPDAWRPILRAVDTTVHLAGRAHAARQTSRDEYVRVNVHMTAALTEACRLEGVRRVVYLSSAAVVGHGRAPSRSAGPAWSEDMPCTPMDDYGRTKLEAERVVQTLDRMGIESVILRPPLVYGPGAPGNFARLLRLVRSLPILPVPHPPNLRSMIFVRNLTDAIARCMSHPAAAGQTFFVADREVLTVAELIRTLARAMHRRVLLLPVPARALRMAGTVTGRADDVARLTNALVLATERIQSRLSWRAPVPASQGLAESAEVGP